MVRTKVLGAGVGGYFLPLLLVLLLLLPLPLAECACDVLPPLPMRKIAVPQTGQVPFTAGRPFFIVTS
jgi:hypothetical protein